MNYSATFAYIRCGNALIGPDIVRDESWMFCSPKERHFLNLFLWKDNFPEIVAAGGFDAVISNPPDKPHEHKEWIQQYSSGHYIRITTRQTGLRILLSMASVSCAMVEHFVVIMSDRFLRYQAGSPLRALLKEEQPEEIISIFPAVRTTGNRQVCVLSGFRTAPHPIPCSRRW